MIRYNDKKSTGVFVTVYSFLLIGSCSRQRIIAKLLKRIKYLLADREFVGEEWFKYLKRKKIPFYIRVRENFYLHDFDAKIRVKFLFE